MLVAPPTPRMSLNSLSSIMRVSVRLRDVKGGVACLQLDGKQLHYRGMIKVDTISFSLLSGDDQDAVIEGFKAFLNGISFPIQILVRNLPYRPDEYLRAMETAQRGPAEMARDYAQFVRILASKHLSVKHEFYIIVPSDHSKIRNKTLALVNAQMQLQTRIDEQLLRLQQLGLTGHRLDDREILALYQSCLLSEETRQHLLTDQQITQTNQAMISTQGPADHHSHVPALADVFREDDDATGLDDKQRRKQKKKKPVRKKGKQSEFVSILEAMTPSSIQVYPWYLHIDDEAGHEFVRTLAFTAYPRSASPGWLESLIRSGEPFTDFSLHIKPVPPQEVSTYLGRKALEWRDSTMAEQRQGKVPDPMTVQTLQDVESIREKLARGDEHIFKLSLFVQIRGQSRRELSERNNRVVAATHSLGFRVLPTHWQHHAGLLSCLPDGNNQLGRYRLFSTSAAATFYPFTGGDISMDTGILFGVQPGGSLITLDPFNRRALANANLVVLAKSGAGKSFFLKTLASRLLSSYNVYVIDPKAEYSRLCEHAGGQYVHFSSTSLQLNPFELYSQQSSHPGTVQLEQGVEAENFFREKLINLTTLFELLLGDEGTLTQKAKAFLYRCLVRTYANRGITGDPTTHSRPAPGIQEFYLVMSSELRGDQRFGVGKDIYGLSERMERYLHLFPNRTRVELNNNFLDFNIRELNDTLKPIGLFMIIEFLWTRMRQAPVIQHNSIILIDEAWPLMRFDQGARFLAEFARRIHKYGGGLWCATQSSNDFLRSEEGRTILAIATMTFLMKQDSSTIESVMRTFRLSSGQRNFLLSAGRGEGLFATRNWTPMEVVASPREAELANTAPTIQQPQVQVPQVGKEDWQLEEQRENDLDDADVSTSPRLPVPSQRHGRLDPSENHWN
jgi:hypothetical protein